MTSISKLFEEYTETLLTGMPDLIRAVARKMIEEELELDFEDRGSYKIVKLKLGCEVISKIYVDS